MLNQGQDVFIHFAGGTKSRVLHAANIIDILEGVVTLSFNNPDSLPSEPAPTATVFFHGPDEFMQQPVEVVAIEDIIGEAGMVISPVGEPVSAESRKCFRVCTVLGEFEAAFGTLGTCKLVDVSAAGVGFLSSATLSLGDAVAIEMKVAGKTSSGRGFIQSIEALGAGYRYGLLCTEDNDTGGLGKGLQQLTMAAQRTQLRRLSGAA
jgi:hypothetical protein